MTRNSTLSATVLAFAACALVSAQNPGLEGANDGSDQLQDANSAAQNDKDPKPYACQADVDGDGTVGVTDMVYVIGNWGFCVSGDPQACGSDINGDGLVNVDDLTAVFMHWGETCPQASNPG